MNARAHDVEVDAAAELKTLEELAGAEQLELAEQAAAVEQATHDPEAWREASTWTVDALSSMLVPAWGLDDADRTRLATSLCRVLDHYLPGAVNGIDSWHPLVQLGATLVLVTASRGVDFKRLKLKPTHPSTAELERAAAAERAADDEYRRAHGQDETTRRGALLPDGDEPQRQNGRGFTIGGG
jgi:hypothetical protein